MAEATSQNRFRKRTTIILYICIVGIFTLGTGLRLLDLTDPPLDYFPQRQERAAIIARSIYYQLLPSADPATRLKAAYLAATMEQREPSVFESLVAVTYLAMGGEHLWVARLYAILFWLLGGVALYLLARRMTSTLAAIAPLIFYFFLPWSVIFSRIFQPDLIMVMLTLWGAYTIYRWSETLSWKWAILTGVIAGVAIYIKLPAIFPLGLMLLGISLATLGFKKALKSLQVWVMLVLFLALPVIYYLFIIPGDSQGWLNFTLSLIYKWFQPSFYIQWIIFAGGLVDLGIAFVSFIGVWLLPKKPRIIALSLWVGYVLYGLAFPYHITTHEYYSIPLIPAVAFSLAPLAGLVFNHLKDHDRLASWMIAATLLFSIFYSGWMGRSILLSKSYRNEAIGWQQMGQALPKEGDLIGITHEDGYRIAYYGWQHVTPWPYSPEDEASLGTIGPMEQFTSLFTEATRGQDYFIITMFDEFNAQPLLKAYLTDHYPIFAEGSGYLIFDLTQTKVSAP
jgi:4-amino-4-deoxy-L-arabinose transferase-like glycosyltransferase